MYQSETVNCSKRLANYKWIFSSTQLCVFLFYFSFTSFFFFFFERKSRLSKKINPFVRTINETERKISAYCKQPNLERTYRIYFVGQLLFHSLLTLFKGKLVQCRTKQATLIYLYWGGRGGGVQFILNYAKRLGLPNANVFVHFKMNKIPLISVNQCCQLYLKLHHRNCTNLQYLICWYLSLKIHTND